MIWFSKVYQPKDPVEVASDLDQLFCLSINFSYYNNTNQSLLIQRPLNSFIDLILIVFINSIISSKRSWMLHKNLWQFLNVRVLFLFLCYKWNAFNLKEVVEEYSYRILNVRRSATIMISNLLKFYPSTIIIFFYPA